MPHRIPSPTCDTIEAIWHSAADRAILQAACETESTYLRAALRTAATNRLLAVESQRRRAMVGA